MTAQQFSREYKSIKHAQSDMRHQARRGYEVASMTDIPQSAGIMRWLTLGFASLVFKPRPHVLVVYRLVRQPVATQTFRGEYGDELVRINQTAPNAFTAPSVTPNGKPLYLTTQENLDVLKNVWLVLVAGVVSASNGAALLWHTLTEKIHTHTKQ